MRHGYRPFYGQGDHAYEAAPARAPAELVVEWPEPPASVNCDAQDEATALRCVADYIEQTRSSAPDWEITWRGYTVTVTSRSAALAVTADSAARYSNPLAAEFALWVFDTETLQTLVRASGSSWMVVTRRALGRLAAIDAGSST